MIPKILPEHIQFLYEEIEKVKAVKFHRDRKDKLLELLSHINETTIWLLSFAVWFSLFNSRWRTVEASRFYSVKPLDKNNTTFEGFLEILRTYENAKWTPRREKPLAKFLAQCDQVHKKFYLSLISREFVRGLPLTELQQHLDLDSITASEIYQEPAPLELGLDELTYPISLRIANFKTTKDCIHIYKGYPHKVVWAVKPESGKIRLTKQIRRDLRIATTPQLALVGFLEKGRVYPIDLFDSGPVSLDYRKDLEVTPLPQRIEKLNTMLSRNMFLKVDSNYIGVANSEGEIADVLKNVIGNVETSEIIIGDSLSAKTGKVSKVAVKLTHGVTDSLWIEDGEPKGLNVWFNGMLRKCSYPFKTRENSFLAFPQLWENRVIKFYYLKIKDKSYCIGKEVMWEETPWRTYRLKGRNAGMWIEKCILCGATSHMHMNRGICEMCEQLHYYRFPKYGIGKWITPTAFTRRKRERGCWEPSLLNAAFYTWRGLRLVANDEGQWMYIEENLGEADEQNPDRS